VDMHVAEIVAEIEGLFHQHGGIKFLGKGFSRLAAK